MLSRRIGRHTVYQWLLLFLTEMVVLITALFTRIFSQLFYTIHV